MSKKDDHKTTKKNQQIKEKIKWYMRKEKHKKEYETEDK